MVFQLTLESEVSFGEKKFSSIPLLAPLLRLLHNCCDSFTPTQIGKKANTCRVSSVLLLK